MNTTFISRSAINLTQGEVAKYVSAGLIILMNTAIKDIFLGDSELSNWFLKWKQGGYQRTFLKGNELQWAEVVSLAEKNKAHIFKSKDGVEVFAMFFPNSNPDVTDVFSKLSIYE